jgi:hypothetical protein
MKILKYSKVCLNNIILDKIKTKDDKKYIDVKYKVEQDGKKIKDVLLFSTSTASLSLINNLQYNLIRGHYLEVLINDMDFYNFILDIEHLIKTLIVKKSNKIFPHIKDEINYNLIDEYFKSNIKLNKIYNNPIIKLNFIKNKKNNNSLIYNSYKKLITEECLQENKDVTLIMRLDKIVLTNYTYELQFVIEQIKLLSVSSVEQERLLNNYKFDDDDDDDNENENKNNNENKDNAENNKNNNIDSDSSENNNFENIN